MESPSNLKINSILPSYDSEDENYSLDFGGRVTRTSQKNCQLTIAEDENEVPVL